MKIRKTVETQDGGVVFQGELSGPELDFVLEIGICTLLKEGALPFASTKSVNTVDIHFNDSDSIQ